MVAVAATVVVVAAIVAAALVVIAPAAVRDVVEAVATLVVDPGLTHTVSALNFFSHQLLRWYI